VFGSFGMNVLTRLLTAVVAVGNAIRLSRERRRAGRQRLCWPAR
jgi:hypothetical protein